MKHHSFKSADLTNKAAFFLRNIVRVLFLLATVFILHLFTTKVGEEAQKFHNKQQTASQKNTN